MAEVEEKAVYSSSRRGALKSACTVEDVLPDNSSQSSQVDTKYWINSSGISIGWI